MKQKQLQKGKQVKKKILDYLKINGTATANEISRNLKIHFYTAEFYLKQLAVEKKVSQLETNYLTVFMLQNGRK